MNREATKEGNEHTEGLQTDIGGQIWVWTLRSTVALVISAKGADRSKNRKLYTQPGSL
jgi:hypothetical protein